MACDKWAAMFSAGENASESAGENASEIARKSAREIMRKKMCKKEHKRKRRGV